MRTPGTSKAASPHLQTGCNVSEVDVQVADKASDGHGGHSKPYYREASSTAVTKHQPEKKKDTKKRSKLEERQDLEVTCSTAHSRDSVSLTSHFVET